MEIKSHSFRGKRWKLVDAGSGNGGICQGPHIKRREMLVPMTGNSQHDLDTVLHEGLHACFWDIDEEGIHESAADLARLLWRLGWRKED